ncbi:MAG: modification methylase [Bacillus thermozeamaize]|mgnify:FL=1|jgi:DNA adenine methylase|uniref:Site-specific DNA-methyltransferase (adenine-specific) n=1 Tax=Bacillus thermozeamaize TaxID=230954 RepID=A0A1Y3PTT7_9BACI|nr:MAG: modification methylase [Bacillus thermozeamaize]
MSKAATIKHSTDDQSMKPPIKWAGGKTQLIKQFFPLFPPNIDSYAEPFLGGGAVFFALRPSEAFLMDNNEELINFYLVVRDHLEDLMDDLKKHVNTEEYYYRIRALDPAELSHVERASRFLYLNKTGYNGLWRVNRQGKHNVPYGHYKNPRILDEDNLRKASEILANADIRCCDFACVLDVAKPGMFIYMDPPYHPLSQTANFTSYTADAFNEDDQRRLADVCRELDRMGCLVMVSNSDTPFIRELYDGFHMTTVSARRAINCRADRRGPVNELVIRNYGGNRFSKI